MDLKRVVLALVGGVVSLAASTEALAQDGSRFRVPDPNPYTTAGRQFLKPTEANPRGSADNPPRSWVDHDRRGYNTPNPFPKPSWGDRYQEESRDSQFRPRVPELRSPNPYTEKRYEPARRGGAGSAR